MGNYTFGSKPEKEAPKTILEMTPQEYIQKLRREKAESWKNDKGIAEALKSVVSSLNDAFAATKKDADKLSAEFIKLSAREMTSKHGVERASNLSNCLSHLSHQARLISVATKAIEHLESSTN
jgi:hypothetical protein